MEKSGFPNLPEKIEHKEKVLTSQPKSVEYFTTTEDGKELKEKILATLPDIRKQYEGRSYDLAQFGASSFVDLAKIKYYLGENYKAEFENAYQFSQEVEATNPYQDNILGSTVLYNYNKNVLEFYKDNNLPPDEIFEKSVQFLRDEALTQNKNDILESMCKLVGNRAVFNIIHVYIRTGEKQKALDIYNSKCTTPKLQAEFFRAAIQATTNEEDRTWYINSLKELLLDVEEDSSREYVDSVHLLGVYAAKANKYHEVEQMIELLPKFFDKALLSWNIAMRKELPEEKRQEYILRAAEDTEKISDDTSHQNDNYMRIAAYYLNKADIPQAKEYMHKVKNKRSIDVNDFLKYVDIESMSENDEMKLFIFNYILDTIPPADDIEAVFKRYLSKVYARMGLIKHLGDQLLEEEQGPLPHLSIGQYVQGVNEYFTKKSLNQFKNTTEQLPIEKMITTPIRAFKFGAMYGDSFKTDPHLLPLHTKVTYDMGNIWRTSDFRKLEGVELTPQVLRSLLVSFEYFKDKKVGISDLMQIIGSLEGSMGEESDDVIAEFAATHPESAARLIRTMITLDRVGGTRHALKFIIRKNTPDRVFTHFLKYFIKDQRFSQKLLPYVLKKEDTPVLRRLLSQYPNEFSTVIDTLSDAHVSSLSEEDHLFEALHDLGSITPALYGVYSSLNGKERKNFIQSLDGMNYDAFFKNQSIDEGIKEVEYENKEDIKMDLVYRAYRPVNISYQQMKNLFEKVADRTSDLKEYSFPEKFPIEISTHAYSMKEGETIGEESFRKINTMLAPSEINEPERNKAIIKMLKGTTDLSEADVKHIFSVLYSTEEYRALLNREEVHSDTQIVNYLSQLKELLTIFVRDNLPKHIQSVIDKENKISNKVTSIVENKDRRTQLLKALGYKKENDQTEDIPTLELASRLFVDTSLSQYVALINKELKKFVKSEETPGFGKKANVYISKNKGSFFAKSSAGLCTAEDLELWNLPNHFHFNVVPESSKFVQGIALGYIEEVVGKKSLVVRGFNPSTEYLKEISGKSFVEEILKVARIFKEDNKLEHIYFVNEGIGNPLSNRPEISSYIEFKYLNSDAIVVPHVMKVSDGKIAQNIILLE